MTARALGASSSEASLVAAAPAFAPDLGAAFALEDEQLNFVRARVRPGEVGADRLAEGRAASSLMAMVNSRSASTGAWIRFAQETYVGVKQPSTALVAHRSRRAIPRWWLKLSRITESGLPPDRSSRIACSAWSVGAVLLRVSICPRSRLLPTEYQRERLPGAVGLVASRPEQCGVPLRARGEAPSSLMASRPN